MKDGHDEVLAAPQESADSEVKEASDNSVQESSPVNDAEKPVEEAPAESAPQ